jgi:hypothetical protein
MYSNQFIGLWPDCQVSYNGALAIQVQRPLTGVLRENSLSTHVLLPDDLYASNPLICIGFAWPKALKNPARLLDTYAT